MRRASLAPDSPRLRQGFRLRQGYGGQAGGQTRRAFTLVELITVMAIMAVLVAMIMGAAKGIQEQQRVTATREMLHGLKAALQNYADAYVGKYPGIPAWDPVPHDGPMRDVTTTGGFNEWKVLFPGTPQVVPSSSWEYYEEAILYAALMSPLRGGPFARALAGRTVVRADGSNQFALFADGWGRPIVYNYNAGELMLRSLGSDPEKDNDDITYYVLQPSGS